MHFEMAAAGAAIIDIGAESTRPVGAREVSTEVELGRLLPVLQRLRGRLSVPLVDRHPQARSGASGPRLGRRDY